MSLLSHLDDRGQAAMVDVGGKPVTRRYARAWGRLSLTHKTLQMITSQGMAKGDVFGAARLAGIMAAKKTGELIPLCHPLPLSWAGVELIPLFPQSAIVIIAEAALAGQTGIEMEALTAVTIAGLTVYDMCKAVDKAMVLSDVALLEKKGGRSGHYIAEDYCRLLHDIEETELENESLVFWQCLANGDVEFRYHENCGALLARASGAKALLLRDKDSHFENVVALGGGLLRSLPMPVDAAPGSGFLKVVKPGFLDNDALLAVLV